MKIKYLAIALLGATIISSPLLAKDKVKPVKITKEMDKASPANNSIQLSSDKMEVAKKKLDLSSSIETDSKTDDYVNSNPSVKATDYNSSRSNKADGVAAPDPDEGDGSDESNSRATDYNSSRSNKNSNHSAFVDADDSDDASSDGKECDCSEAKKDKNSPEVTDDTVCVIRTNVCHF